MNAQPEWIPSSTGEKHLFSISVSVFYVLCTFVLLGLQVKCFSRYCAVIMLWTISCVVQASEHLLTARIFFVDVCIDLGGKKIPLRLFLDVGIWNLNEWKCICVTSSESVRSRCSSLGKQGWEGDTGVISARSLWAYCQSPAFWAVTHSADSQKQGEIQYALRKETLLCVVLHKCTSGVLVPGEFPYPREASITAHWKWSAFSSKGESQLEAVGKEEEPSASSRTEGPQGPPRRPGGGQNNPLPLTTARPFFGAGTVHQREKSCTLHQLRCLRLKSLSIFLKSWALWGVK